METQVAKPLSPKVRAELEAAEGRRRSLQAGVDALALDSLSDPKARAKLDKLEAELATATATISRLQKALEQALQRDAATAAAELLRKQRVQLSEFEKLCEARRRAAADIDTAVAALAEAYFRLRAGGHLIPTMVPTGLRLPQGYLGRDLKKLVAHGLHRVSGSAQIGDQTLPGAEPPSTLQRYNAPAIPTSAETIGRECDWLLRSLANQIEARAQRNESEAA